MREVAAVNIYLVLLGLAHEWKWLEPDKRRGAPEDRRLVLMKAKYMWVGGPPTGSACQADVR